MMEEMTKSLMKNVHAARMTPPFVFSALLKEGDNIGRHIIDKLSGGQLTAIDFMVEVMNVNA